MTDPRIEAAARALGQMLGDETEGAYLDEAGAILAAADAAAWRPIESAPANKGIILVTGDFVFYGFKDEMFSDGELFYSCTEGLKGGAINPQPTHWKPMPAPPASIAELGGVDG